MARCWTASLRQGAGELLIGEWPLTSDEAGASSQAFPTHSQSTRRMPCDRKGAARESADRAEQTASVLRAVPELGKRASSGTRIRYA